MQQGKNARKALILWDFFLKINWKSPEQKSKGIFVNHINATLDLGNGKEQLLLRRWSLVENTDVYQHRGGRIWETSR